MSKGTILNYVDYENKHQLCNWVFIIKQHTLSSHRKSTKGRNINCVIGYSLLNSTLYHHTGNQPMEVFMQGTNLLNYYCVKFDLFDYLLC